MSYTDSTGSTDRSTTSTTNDVCSFLEPRDPSITKPWMRPHPTQGTNLCDLFEDECSLDTSGINDQHLRVYLRIKPTKKFMEKCYCVQSKTSFVTLQNSHKTNNKRNDKVKQIFNFTHIFDDPNNSQIEVYDHFVKKNLNKFIDGQDFTILTYGASGSGKTYSLMGTDMEPGIIPRFLEDLFARIDIDRLPNFKPADGNNVIRLNSVQKEKEIQNIQWIVKNCSNAGFTPGNATHSESKDCLETYRRMSTVLIGQTQNWHSKQPKITKKYDVWVSFAEIYNEAIFDLLREDSSIPNQPPIRLRLVRAANNQQYIKGIRWICVRNGAEAFAALERGKCRLRYAHTNINKQSSRSHSIFFLKIVHYNSDFSDDTFLSTFRLCDLAGSERAKKTGNEGLRLTESRMINSSLHVLERCLASLRSQQEGQQSLPPYRESKLTSLLQNALSGNEAIAMMVNINPDPLFFDETHHVLQFSAIAKEIVRYVEPTRKLESFRRSKSFSDVSCYSLDETTEISFDESTHSEVQDLRDELERIKKEVNEKLQQKESEVRRELVDKFMKLNKQKDIDYDESLKKDRERHGKFHEEELKAFEEEIQEKINHLEAQLEAVNTENCRLKKNIIKLEKELQEKANNLKIDSFYSEKCGLTESIDNSEKHDSVGTNSFHSIHNSDIEENIKSSSHSDIIKKFIESNIKQELESPKSLLNNSPCHVEYNSTIKNTSPKSDIDNTFDARNNSTVHRMHDFVKDLSASLNNLVKTGTEIECTANECVLIDLNTEFNLSSGSVDGENEESIKDDQENIPIVDCFKSSEKIMLFNTDANLGQEKIPLNDNNNSRNKEKIMSPVVCFKSSEEIMSFNTDPNQDQENIPLKGSPKNNRINIPFNIENFCTLKKEKMSVDDFSGISSISKSKRKLFCRREFDENAAEHVEHLKSTRQLDFGDDSPETLQPPKLNKLYTVEQAGVRRSSRKKPTTKRF